MTCIYVKYSAQIIVYRSNTSLSGRRWRWGTRWRRRLLTRSKTNVRIPEGEQRCNFPIIIHRSNSSLFCFQALALGDKVAQPLPVAAAANESFKVARAAGQVYLRCCGSEAGLYFRLIDFVSL